MAKSVKRAPMVRVGRGKKPVGPGWFVLNAKESAWHVNPLFGASTSFEGETNFGEFGFNIHVIGDNQPNCHYHAESHQEDFLVLSGRCRLLIEGQEIALKAWDFVHCPPWTHHVFVGKGKEPCVIIMVGGRTGKDELSYPRLPLALKYKAGATKSTPNPRESYSDTPRWQPGPPYPMFAKRKVGR